MCASFFSWVSRKKDIYFYEDEIQVTENKVSLCKPIIDHMTGCRALEHNDKGEINRSVDELYSEMKMVE